MNGAGIRLYIRVAIRLDGVDVVTYPEVEQSAHNILLYH